MSSLSLPLAKRVVEVTGDLEIFVVAMYLLVVDVVVNVNSDRPSYGLRGDATVHANRADGGNGTAVVYNDDILFIIT